MSNRHGVPYLDAFTRSIVLLLKNHRGNNAKFRQESDIQWYMHLLLLANNPLLFFPFDAKSH